MTICRWWNYCMLPNVSTSTISNFRESSSLRNNILVQKINENEAQTIWCETIFARCHLRSCSILNYCRTYDVKVRVDCFLVHHHQPNEFICEFIIIDVNLNFYHVALIGIRLGASGHDKWDRTILFCTFTFSIESCAGHWSLSRSASLALCIYVNPNQKQMARCLAWRYEAPWKEKKRRQLH